LFYLSYLNALVLVSSINLYLLLRLYMKAVTDSRHKIVNFEFKRKFKSIPVVSSFLGSAWNCQAQIHLESQGSDAGKMYVSRVNVKERPHASFVNATYVLLLPSFLLLSSTSLTLSSIFSLRRPFNPPPLLHHGLNISRKGTNNQILLLPPTLLLPIRNLHLPSLSILPQPRQRFLVTVRYLGDSSTSDWNLECSHEGTESC